MFQSSGHQNPLSFYFTIYGEVYVGENFPDFLFPDHTILIQRSRIRDYNQLPTEKKTLEVIKEFGYAIPNHTIAAQKQLTKNHFDLFQTKNERNSWYEYDRRIMFIVGAGASANCVFGQEKEALKKGSNRPPLGPGLFDKRFEKFYNKYPGVKQSLYFLQSEKGADVEGLFEEEWKDIYEHGNQYVIARHINIQYYIQELLQHISLSMLMSYDTKNLYGVLADKLVKLYYRDPTRKKKFAFVSFNQDNILERFITRSSGLQFNSINDYTRINEGIFSVFKPHGSWNWGWEFPNLTAKSITTPQWLFQENTNHFKLYYDLLGDYKTMIDWESYGITSQLHDHSIGKYNVNKSNLSIIYPGNENLYFPALLLPYRDKDEFTMPASHYWHLHQYLEYVETLVIIGWKGNEKYFNKLLETRGTKIKTVIIADPDWEVVLENLPFLSQKKITVKHYSGGFEDFVMNGMDNEPSLKDGVTVKPYFVGGI